MSFSVWPSVLSLNNFKLLTLTNFHRILKICTIWYNCIKQRLCKISYRIKVYNDKALRILNILMWSHLGGKEHWQNLVHFCSNFSPNKNFKHYDLWNSAPKFLQNKNMLLIRIRYIIIERDNFNLFNPAYCERIIFNSTGQLSKLWPCIQAMDNCLHRQWRDFTKSQAPHNWLAVRAICLPGLTIKVSLIKKLGSKSFDQLWKLVGPPLKELMKPQYMLYKHLIREVDNNLNNSTCYL